MAGKSDPCGLLTRRGVLAGLAAGGILIGIAISEGAIKSVDDTPGTYVPGFGGTEYGNTAIRDLLHMSSGVDFGEERDGGRDLNRSASDDAPNSWRVANSISANHRSTELRGS
jgi:CubicO group peptidase (beta-lactamase class C family)